MKSGGSNYGVLKWQKQFLFGVFITQFCQALEEYEETGRGHERNNRKGKETKGKKHKCNPIIAWGREAITTTCRYE